MIIKRWIDGERVAVREDYEGLAAELNRRQKEIAAHDRHYALLTAIHGAVRLEITGRVLWSEKGKVALWIDDWKTIVRIKTIAAPGDTIKLRYFCDRRKAQWKERIIYEVIKGPENTSSGAHI